ncbi:hypothetical protein Bca4012_011798 [Brassica carinata]
MVTKVEDCLPPATEQLRCYNPSSTPCGARDHSKLRKRVIFFSLSRLVYHSLSTL